MSQLLKPGPWKNCLLYTSIGDLGGDRPSEAKNQGQRENPKRTPHVPISLRFPSHVLLLENGVAVGARYRRREAATGLDITAGIRGDHRRDRLTGDHLVLNRAVALGDAGALRHVGVNHRIRLRRGKDFHGGRRADWANRGVVRSPDRDNGVMPRRLEMCIRDSR